MCMHLSIYRKAILLRKSETRKSEGYPRAVSWQPGSNGGCREQMAGLRNGLIKKPGTVLIALNMQCVLRPLAVQWQPPVNPDEFLPTKHTRTSEDQVPVQVSGLLRSSCALPPPFHQQLGGGFHVIYQITTVGIALPCNT